MEGYRSHMKKLLHILRRENADSQPYWEDYVYETDDESATVATALFGIGPENRVGADGLAGQSVSQSAAQSVSQSTAQTVSGSSAQAADRNSGVSTQKKGSGDHAGYRPVAWDHSCLQKRCGACAMVINKVPALACNTELRDLPGEKVTLEPLRKFPVVEDLLVDRSAMMENLKSLSVWLEADVKRQDGTEDMAFEASRCLQCGLCLEVCPNFVVGLKFSGMAAMAPMARLIAQLPDEMRRTVSKNYKKGVYNGCGKSLACRDICPAGIDIDRLLVKSNAAAVWGRWRQKNLI